ncbi:hypothetical protein DMENIID0001_041900 [Sergentomyia squamirostris]
MLSDFHDMGVVDFLATQHEFQHSGAVVVLVCGAVTAPVASLAAALVDASVAAAAVNASSDTSVAAAVVDESVLAQIVASATPAPMVAASMVASPIAAAQIVAEASPLATHHRPKN